MRKLRLHLRQGRPCGDLSGNVDISHENHPPRAHVGRRGRAEKHIDLAPIERPETRLGLTAPPQESGLQSTAICFYPSGIQWRSIDLPTKSSRFLPPNMVMALWFTSVITTDSIAAVTNPGWASV